MTTTIYFYESFGRYGQAADIATRFNPYFAWRVQSAILHANGGRYNEPYVSSAQLGGGIVSGAFSSAYGTMVHQMAILTGPQFLLVYFDSQTSGQGNLPQFQITGNPITGAISILSPTFVVLASTANNVLPSATWYSAAFKITVGNPGSVEIRINGATITTLSANLVNPSSANNTFDNLSMGQAAGFTDVIFSSDYVDPDAACVWLHPNGAGDETDWISSSGNPNWQNVAGFTQSTVFNSSSTVGNIDLTTIDNTPILNQVILALEPGMQDARSAAAARSMATIMKSAGGTITLGPSWALSNGQQVHGDVPYSLDPGTSSAWLYNALPQSGYKLTA